MLDAYQALGPLRLPQSHADQVGLGATGFTYDAALAVLGWLADGRPASLRRALLVGRSLGYAQSHDPQFDDGRLRRAYNVGPYRLQQDGFVRPDGTVNIAREFGFLSSAVGDLAIVGIAWLQLAARTGQAEFVDAALRLGDWIDTRCRSAGSLGGYVVGTDNAGRVRTSASTAHNADLVEFFRQLAGQTGYRRWERAAGTAADFVARMWQPDRCHFAAGSPDGNTVDRSVGVLDAQTHAVLALPGYAGSLDWAGSALTVTDTADRPNSALLAGEWFTGPTVSTASEHVNPGVPIEPGLPKPDPCAVWLEGTGQLASALRDCPDAGHRVTAGRHQYTLGEAQAVLGRGQTVGGRALPEGCGVPAASSPLHVGFEASGYYPVRHVGATAWYVLAASGRHPFRPAVGT
jgi:hypothetical protein